MIFAIYCSFLYRVINVKYTMCIPYIYRLDITCCQTHLVIFGANLLGETHRPTVAWFPVYCGESISRPRLWIGSKSHSNCGWIWPFGRKCGTHLADSFLILKWPFTAKSPSNELSLCLPPPRALLVSDRPTPHRSFVEMFWTLRHQLSVQKVLRQ